MYFKRLAFPNLPSFKPAILETNSVRCIDFHLRGVMTRLKNEIPDFQQNCRFQIAEFGCASGPLFQVLPTLFNAFDYCGIDRRFEALPADFESIQGARSFEFHCQDARDFRSESPLDIVFFRHFPVWDLLEGRDAFVEVVGNAINNLKPRGLVVFTFFEQNRDFNLISPEASTAIKLLSVFKLNMVTLKRELLGPKISINTVGFCHDNTVLVMRKMGSKPVCVKPKVNKLVLILNLMIFMVLYIVGIRYLSLFPTNSLENE